MTIIVGMIQKNCYRIVLFYVVGQKSVTADPYFGSFHLWATVTRGFSQFPTLGEFFTWKYRIVFICDNQIKIWLQTNFRF